MKPRKRNVVKNAPKTEAFSIAVCKPLKEDIDDIAARLDISRNALINEALMNYVDEYCRNNNIAEA